MTIFSSNLGTAALPGFTLLRQQSGRLFMGVTQGQNNFSRFAELTPVDGVVPLGEWMHVAVVGSGPGNPVKFYITPAGSSQVIEYTSTSTLIGADGNYPTDFTHDLLIGGGAGVSPWQGGMVNQAIYNTALTKAQVQQLFDFGTGQTAPEFPWHNADNPLDVDGNGLIQNVDLLQVINRLIALGITDLSPPSGGNAPPPYIDTTGNNRLEPLDALRVVNYLIANPPGGSGGSAQATALSTSQATDAAEETTLAKVAATTASANVESPPEAKPAIAVFALPSSLAANTPSLGTAADLAAAPNHGAEPPAPASATVVNVSASYSSAKRRAAANADSPLAADLALDALRRDDLEDDFELDCDVLGD
jgi:hypothetical protein